MIYDRQLDVPATIKNIDEDVKEIKQSQLVGNDNLIVRYYSDILTEQSITTSGAVFRAEFVFDNPSDTFVAISFSLSSTSTFTADQFIYEDPQTINSQLSQAALFNIVPTTNITGVNIFASAKSTSEGTFTLTRL